MARTYQRSMFDELDDLWEYVNCMFQQALQPADLPLLSSGERSSLPASLRQEMRADVVDHEDEVIVTVDIIPGIGKKDISLDLIHSQALRISCERQMERREEREGYYLHERKFGSVQRIITLPAPVTETGAKSTFRNGVLEVHLKKTKEEQKSRIQIE